MINQDSNSNFTHSKGSKPSHFHALEIEILAAEELNTLTELANYAQKVQMELKQPSLVLLKGDLGVGKTAFVKAFCLNNQIPSRKVKSPTFSLINTYQTPELTINHLDLYRLEKSDLALEQDIQEQLTSQNNITFIEWGERLSNLEQFLNVRTNLYLLEIKILNSQQGTKRRLEFKMLKTKTRI